MTITPIAHRETDSVTRSQTPSQRSSSPGMSTLASDRLRFVTSLRRKRQMKSTVKAVRKIVKKSARHAEHGRDRVRNRSGCAVRPGLNVPADPRVAEPRELVRRAELLDRSSATAGESPSPSRPFGTRNRSARTVTASAVPSTVTVAASPTRHSRLRRSRSARGTRRRERGRRRRRRSGRCSPIDAKAAKTATAAATISTVRIGR